MIKDKKEITIHVNSYVLKLRFANHLLVSALIRKSKSFGVKYLISLRFDLYGISNLEDNEITSKLFCLMPLSSMELTNCICLFLYSVVKTLVIDLFSFRVKTQLCRFTTMDLKHVALILRGYKNKT